MGLSREELFEIIDARNVAILGVGNEEDAEIARDAIRSENIALFGVVVRDYLVELTQPLEEEAEHLAEELADVKDELSQIDQLIRGLEGRRQRHERPLFTDDDIAQLGETITLAQLKDFAYTHGYSETMASQAFKGLRSKFPIRDDSGIVSYATHEQSSSYLNVDHRNLFNIPLLADAYNSDKLRMFRIGDKTIEMFSVFLVRYYELHPEAS